MAATKKGGDKVAAKAPAAPAAAVYVPAPRAPETSGSPRSPSVTPAASSKKGHGFRRRMTGRVIRDKMNKTVTVEVVSARRDALYGKYVRVRNRYKAHDENNQFRIGDEVEIQEHRPLSSEKRFIVTRLVKKFVEE